MSNLPSEEALRALIASERGFRHDWKGVTEAEARAALAETANAHARGAIEALERLLREYAEVDGPNSNELRFEIAALRNEKPGTKSPVTAEGTMGGLKEAKDTEAPRVDLRQNAAPSVSALTDADVLERAAEIVEDGGSIERSIQTSTAALRKRAAALRAQEGLVNAADPDVFERVALEWYTIGEPPNIPNLAALLRERFSPLVEALEWYSTCNLNTTRALDALAVRRTLRGEEAR